MTRRDFMPTAALSGLALPPAIASALRYAPASVPVRAITTAPGYHWFGYYDKLQFDPTGRYVLGMRVDFEGRSPTSDDAIEIGMVDLRQNDRWIHLGQSHAWGWQQGCMLQWLAGSGSEVIWNDRVDDHYVSHVLDVFTGKKRTLPRAIYALSPDGKWAVGTEFNRIQNLRPGYGYAGVDDPYRDQKAPPAIGLYRMELKTGQSTMLLSLAQAAAIPYNGADVRDNYHWFNHLLVNTDGSRLLLLNRWRSQPVDRQTGASGGFTTRMFTINPDGSDPFIVDPSGFTSHIVWRDPTIICAFTKPPGRAESFYLLEDKTGTITPIKSDKMPVNGHQTYVPNHNNEWLVNDNYARPGARNQIPYLYHIFLLTGASTSARFRRAKATWASGGATYTPVPAPTVTSFVSTRPTAATGGSCICSIYARSGKKMAVDPVSQPNRSEKVVP